MRNVWLLGGDVQVKQNLEKAFEAHAAVTQWRVHLAGAVSDIPENDILSNGTVIICDAFHPTYPAFEGVKAVRGAGFSGPVFLSGEPSPELAVSPFMQSGLTGYFPSFDRADYYFVAGLIASQLYFEGELDLRKFLMPAGRFSSEQVSSFKEFNAFGAKLATFVAKFGIDVAHVRKLLMGLGLPHIKGAATGPVVEQPFKLYFGMDPQKVIVAVGSYSRGAAKQAILSDFSHMLVALKDQKAMPGTLFPELFHIGRATQNLILLTGNAKKQAETLDPLFLITAIPFPKLGTRAQGPINLFAFMNAIPTAEALEEVPVAAAPTPAVIAAPVEVPAAATAEAPKVVAPPAQPIAAKVDVAAPIAPHGVLEAQDMKAILDEPQVVGDQPVLVDPHAKHTDASLKKDKAAATVAQATAAKAVKTGAAGKAANAKDSAAALELAAKLQVAEHDLAKLKEISGAMGQDIRRLMRERRVPSTDRELRDAVGQLDEKLKVANQDRAAAQKMCEDKDAMIATLRAQVDSLSSKKAA